MKAFKMLKQGNNPYEEDTRSWHQYIDISCSERDGIATLDVLTRQHAMAPEYYDDVSELVEDGLVEIVEVPNE